MFINALNPGPAGARAEGDLDDDEDSGGHRLLDTVRAAHYRLAAVNRELTYTDRERNREYRITEGELPFFMHRERGLHLDEPDVTIDGAPVPAAILGTALTLFYAGRAQADRGQGIYFYLPSSRRRRKSLVPDLFDVSAALPSLPGPPSGHSPGQSRCRACSRWRRCYRSSAPTRPASTPPAGISRPRSSSG
jgi:malate synthase